MSTELLDRFEELCADGFPLGEKGAEVLDQLERVSKLCTELKEFYKAQLERDPRCVPGWTLRPTTRRYLGNPAKVWERLSDTLSSDQFMAAVTLKVGVLQDIWANANCVPATKAKELFNQELGDLVIEFPSAPTLVRTK